MRETPAMTRRMILVLAALALPLAACNSGSSATSDGDGSASGDPAMPESDVYLPPEPLPAGVPGELIWAEEVDAPADAKAWKVLYHSESLDGEDIAVSGLVVAPDGPVPEGGRPVVTWAHGTRGLADACAPSKEPTVDEAIPGLSQMLDAGYVAVATDYEGLGTPGVHPFLVGESEGRGVLDVARAVTDLDDAGASDQVAIWGMSQGGHAALFAGQIAPDYAPELDVVGVAAGAPVGNLPLLLDVASGIPDFVGFVVMGGMGFAAAYPEADPTEILTPTAQEEAVVVEEQCAEDVLATFSKPVDEVIAKNPLDVDPWPELLETNTPGGVATEAPVHVFQGGEDALVPEFVTDEYVGRVCELGTVIDLVVYPGADHGGVFEPALEDNLTWIADRFAGAESPDTCP